MNMLRKSGRNKQKKVKKTYRNTDRIPMKIDALEPRLLLSNYAPLDPELQMETVNLFQVEQQLFPIETNQTAFVENESVHALAKQLSSAVITDKTVNFSQLSAVLIDLRELNGFDPGDNVDFRITSSIGTPDSDGIYSVKSGTQDAGKIFLDAVLTGAGTLNVIFKDTGKFVFFPLDPTGPVTLEVELKEGAVIKTQNVNLVPQTALIPDNIKLSGSIGKTLANQKMDNNLLDVMQVQYRLNKLGYRGSDGLPLKINGKYDEQLGQAISLFQRTIGVPYDLARGETIKSGEHDVQKTYNFVSGQINNSSYPVDRKANVSYVTYVNNWLKSSSAPQWTDFKQDATLNAMFYRDDLSIPVELYMEIYKQCQDNKKPGGECYGATMSRLMGAHLKATGVSFYNELSKITNYGNFNGYLNINNWNTKTLGALSPAEVFFRLFSSSSLPGWSEIPIQLRGTGAAGALVFSGFAGDMNPDDDDTYRLLNTNDIKSGMLGLGAVIQGWNTNKAYENARKGAPLEEKQYGHSMIFLGYKESGTDIIGMYTMETDGAHEYNLVGNIFKRKYGDGNLYFEVLFGANPVNFYIEKNNVPDTLKWGNQYLGDFLKGAGTTKSISGTPTGEAVDWKIGPLSQSGYVDTFCWPRSMTHLDKSTDENYIANDSLYYAQDQNTGLSFSVIYGRKKAVDGTFTEINNDDDRAECITHYINNAAKSNNVNIERIYVSSDALKTIVANKVKGFDTKRILICTGADSFGVALSLKPNATIVAKQPIPRVITDTTSIAVETKKPTGESKNFLQKAWEWVTAPFKAGKKVDGNHPELKNTFQNETQIGQPAGALPKALASSLGGIADLFNFDETIINYLRGDDANCEDLAAAIENYIRGCIGNSATRENSNISVKE